MTPGLTCRDGVELAVDYLEGALDLRARGHRRTRGRVSRCVAFVKSYVETPRIVRTATAEALPAERAAALRRFLASRR